MAKRFTDTNKWDHAWFRKLTPKMKVVWIYLLDKCDHAGVWTADFEAMGFHVGETVEVHEFEKFFGNKISPISSDKYLIQSFVDFQYGNLNPDNRVHQSVLLRLEKLGPKKPLISPLQGAKDKDKDTDKEKDKDKDKEKEVSFSDLEAVYRRYPLKKGKTKGLAKAKAEIKTKAQWSDLSNAVGRYIEDCRVNKKEPQFIMHFSTFMQSWRDWLDPNTGTAESFQQKHRGIAEILADEGRSA